MQQLLLLLLVLLIQAETTERRVDDVAIGDETMFDCLSVCTYVCLVIIFYSLSVQKINANHREPNPKTKLQIHQKQSELPEGRRTHDD